MSLQQIDAKMLSKMFLAGAKNLESKKEWINELNVFPVPDGDTGTNMTMTIMSAAKEVASLGENPDMEGLCKAVSGGSLRGARGNSGVILSQLLRGFTKRIKNEEILTVSVLVEAFEKAVETAYKAVMKPKEGTILTVARGGAERAKALAEEGAEDMGEFLADVVEHARYVLSQTPEMLPVLKQAGVVDSGGQGLVEVMAGALDAFMGRETDFSIPVESGKTPSRNVGAAEQDIEIKFGYCTEFIILLNKAFNIKAEIDFKAYLESIGDSIVCVADEDVVKVHVHTNDPGLAIQKALKYGALSNMKIDNMRLEHKEKLLEVIQVYSAAHSFDEVVPISAKTGQGVKELLDVLEGYLPEGPQLFPEEMTSDQPERQMMAEIMREKLLLLLDKEIPHGTAVEITRFAERDDELVEVEATIYCEKNSHKGIIIGKGGAMLKKASTLARQDMEKFMGTKVFLKTWVKVKENWRDNPAAIQNFGYRKE